MSSAASYLHGVLGICGFILSVLTLGLLLKRKRLAKSPLGIAIGNLSIMCLGFSVFGHMIFILPSKLSKYWLYEEDGCLLLGLLRTFFRNSILSGVMVFTMERLFCLEISSRLNPSPFFFITCGLWIYNLVWAAIPIFWIHQHQSRLHSCEMQMELNPGNIVVTSIINTATFILPASIIIYFIMKIRKFFQDRKKRVVKLRLPDSWLFIQGIYRTTFRLSIAALFIFALFNVTQWLHLIYNQNYAGYDWLRYTYAVFEQAPIFLNPGWYLLIPSLWQPGNPARHWMVSEPTAHSETLV